MKKKLEKDIQREICDYLAENNYFFWRSNNIPVFDRNKNKFRALPKYTPRGLPDIIIIYKGYFIALEVKIPDYWKLTDSQVEMRFGIENNGGFYFLVTSIDETIGALTKMMEYARVNS